MSCVRYATMKSLRRKLIAALNPSWQGHAASLRFVPGMIPSWLWKHSRRDYIVQAVLSSPPWVDIKALRELQRQAAALPDGTLDHEVPLNHPRVCGLTVPWNLKVSTRAANLSKGNAWCQWHGELFDQPEQLRLML